MSTHLLAWLFWDPHRELITLPFIEKPILWYGFLFVLGFVIGYFIVLPMFRELLNKDKIIKTRDIASYSEFINLIKTQKYNHKGINQQLLSLLPPTFISELSLLPPNTELSNLQKKILLSTLNKLYTSTSHPISREDLEIAFPNAIKPLRQLCFDIADKLLWYLIGGALIGARLGHVFFYNWPIFRNDLLSIVKIWEGGLASHGGAVGIIIALMLFVWQLRDKYPEITLIRVMDIIVVPTALAGCLIRIGNFFNQEILGTPSHVPWAIIFGHPADGSFPQPRHPVQLYEAAAYLVIFLMIYTLWKRFKDYLRPGILSGIFLITIFSARFFLEFFKATQSLVVNESILLAGQYLSIPFILLGVLLIRYGWQWDEKFLKPNCNLSRT